MKTYTAIYAIPEMIIALIGVACIVWLLWTVREDNQAIAKDVLDQAWRDVLNDPHYLERRHFETQACRRLRSQDTPPLPKADRARYFQSTKPRAISRGICRRVGSQYAHNVRYRH